MLSIAFSVFACCLLLQLLYPVAAVGLAQLLPVKGKKPGNPDPPRHYGCIITAYQNIDIARPLLESLLRQQYPHFTAYLVADECPAPAWGFSDPRIHILRPEQPLRLKAKSIIHAVDRLEQAHDYLVIFDADNVAHPDFLSEIDRFARQGYACIQGRRTAKNLDSSYAALDSLGEHYKNYLERETAWRLGSSAVIAGSGMATRTDLYRAYLDSPDIQQGMNRWKKMLQEDKILQNFLLRRNERIAWARTALVYDEKTGTAAAVETQRSRWLYSYFQNIPNALDLLLRGIRGGHFNQTYFGAITLALPMFIQVGLALLAALAGWWISPWWTLALLGALGVFALNVLWVLYLDGAPPAVWRALWRLPRFVWRQFRALFKMRNPDKYFRHTEHRQALGLEDIIPPHEPRQD